MKLFLLLSLTFGLSLSGLRAQQSAADPAILGKVGTTWPGVQYQVLKVQRFAGNRLVFFIVVCATHEAPPGGTFIGLRVPAPKIIAPKNGPPLPHTDPYILLPFPIDSATMTDDTTGQAYSTVKADGNTGSTIATLHPDESVLLSIQFPSPPPLGPATGADPRQTVSILLPRAVGPITKVVIPPPAAPAAATP